MISERPGQAVAVRFCYTDADDLDGSTRLEDYPTALGRPRSGHLQTQAR